MTNAREELVKELIILVDSNTCLSSRRKFPPSYDHRTMKKYRAIADFILSRQEKILRPLVDISKQPYYKYFEANTLRGNIDETLRNAGVKEEGE